MNRLYWDSMLFIYLLEGNPVFGKRVLQLHQAMRRRGDVLCTSVFTLGEVLTGPAKRKDEAGIRGIKQFFAGGTIQILPFSSEAAERYSVIRASTRVTQADAIHLATAAVNGVDLFITNDAKLHSLILPGIRFFADMDGKLI